MKSTSTKPEDLIKNLRALLEEAEKHVGAGADATDSVAEGLQARLAAAKEQLSDLCQKSKEKLCECAKATDAQVRTHPYETAAIALGVGVLLGAILKSRRH